MLNLKKMKLIKKILNLIYYHFYSQLLIPIEFFFYKIIYFLNKNDFDVSLVVTSGNRKELTDIWIENAINQNYINFKIYISIYADKENTYNYLKKKYNKEIKKKKLILIETNAKVFNKAKASNLVIKYIKTKYIFFIDCDLPFENRSSLKNIIYFISYHNNYKIFSLYAMGQIFLSKSLFESVDGYSGNLSDIHAPDDFDLINRVIVKNNCKYYFRGKGLKLRIIPKIKRFEVIYKENPYEKKYFFNTEFSHLYVFKNRSNTFYHKFFNLIKKTRKDQFETVLNFFLANKQLLKSNKFIKKLSFNKQK